MISRPQIDRLIALGRRRGTLEIADIGEVLPIDSLSIDEISYVLSLLEDAGISVEVDPAFLSPRHEGNAFPSTAAQASTPTPGHAAAAATRVSQPPPSITGASATPKHDAPPPYPARPATVFVVIGTGIALIVVLGFWTYFSG